ncbi:aspartate/glutamate racemase family protein [Paraburkholderia caffeinilytica]|uniref:aspartate/glutamate racemase family protein n=1 Tax=Paraburkholderia caffeinilytica TaxID=1761016 RepID=UPI003DA11CD8
MKPLGILMLDTRFPRPRGDIGNRDTFPYPVVFKVVSDASPTRVIHQQAEGLVDAFCREAQALETEGCGAIVTSCGFLALHQRRLADAVSIPVGTSSLLLIPLLKTLLGHALKVGVLTASRHALSGDHLDAAGAPRDTPIVGMLPDGEFARVIIGNQTEGDFGLIEEEVVQAARDLIAQTPELGAVVLECTNMGPYRAAISAACGRPVFDLVDLAHFLMQHALVR